jgi:hypothetical protein
VFLVEAEVEANSLTGAAFVLVGRCWETEL